MPSEILSANETALPASIDSRHSTARTGSIIVSWSVLVFRPRSRHHEQHHGGDQQRHLWRHRRPRRHCRWSMQGAGARQQRLFPASLTERIGRAMLQAASTLNCSSGLYLATSVLPSQMPDRPMSIEERRREEERNLREGKDRYSVLGELDFRLRSASRRQIEESRKLLQKLRHIP